MRKTLRNTLIVLVLLVSLLAIVMSIAGAQDQSTIPEKWQGLLGKYGEAEGDHFYLRENSGQMELLYSSPSMQDRRGLIRFNQQLYLVIPLQDLCQDVFHPGFNPFLTLSAIQFIRDDQRRGISCQIGEEIWNRLFFEVELGKTFTITPLRPVKKLFPEALAAKPPVEKGPFLKTDLVEVTKLDSSIHLDIRYATSNNFMGTAFYSEPRAFLQRPAAKALIRVQKKLKDFGYGLIIHDAYRPWYVTKMFWDATPEKLRNFVADPQKGSRHNRGGAVDVSMYDLRTGKPVSFGGGYDEFSERSSIFYPGGTTLERGRRALLRTLMMEEEFEPYEDEWWHFDYKTSKQYPILNITFDKIGK